MNLKVYRKCPVCRSRKTKIFLEKSFSAASIENITLSRCLECRTIFQEFYSTEFDDNLNNSHYAKYAGKSKPELYHPLTDISYEKVLDILLKHAPGRSILDVACGIGGFVDAASRRGWTIQGIELAEGAVAIARKFNLNVQNVDFFSDSILAGSRDIVTMFEVIEHLPNPGAFLRRAEEVVRPGGLIYLTTPNFNSLERRVVGSQWHNIHLAHITYFTPNTIIGAVRRHTNLELLKIETRNISPYFLGAVYRKFAVSRKREESSCNMSTNLQDTDTREIINRSPLLSRLKNYVNMLLDLTCLGDSMVIVLKKPDTQVRMDQLKK